MSELGGFLVGVFTHFPSQILGRIKLFIYDLSKILDIVGTCSLVDANGVFVFGSLVSGVSCVRCLTLSIMHPIFYRQTMCLTYLLNDEKFLSYMS